MPNSRQRLGQRGEDLVTSRLQRAGYTILARNWRHGQLGELDIIAQHRTQIIFVEVRTRRGPLKTATAWALESITPHKQARLLALAQAYLAAHGLEHVPWRVDIAAVACQNNTLSMEVITHALEW